MTSVTFRKLSFGYKGFKICGDTDFFKKMFLLLGHYQIFCKEERPSEPLGKTGLPASTIERFKR